MTLLTIIFINRVMMVLSRGRRIQIFSGDDVKSRFRVNHRCVVWVKHIPIKTHRKIPVSCEKCPSALLTWGWTARMTILIKHREDKIVFSRVNYPGHYAKLVLTKVRIAFFV